MTTLNKTAHKILDIAEHYTQTRGFNAFSYRDIQNQVGIKTSSIHYYFPTKHDLAYVMTERYVDRFRMLLEKLETTHDSGIERLEALAKIFTDVVQQGKFCMCGMLASDFATLPDNANEKLQEFFALNQAWIAKAIDLGKKNREILRSVDTQRAAALFFAMLEGGMMIARTQRDPGYLATNIQQAIAQIRA